MQRTPEPRLLHAGERNTFMEELWKLSEAGRTGSEPKTQPEPGSSQERTWGFRISPSGDSACFSALKPRTGPGVLQVHSMVLVPWCGQRHQRILRMNRLVLFVSLGGGGHEVAKFRQAWLWAHLVRDTVGCAASCLKRSRKFPH